MGSGPAGLSHAWRQVEKDRRADFNNSGDTRVH